MYVTAAWNEMIASLAVINGYLSTDFKFLRKI
jgi:hypothetical protein